MKTARKGLRPGKATWPAQRFKPTATPGNTGSGTEIQPPFQGELQILSDDSVYSLIYAAPNPNYTAGGGTVFYAAPDSKKTPLDQSTPVSTYTNVVPSGLTYIPTVTFMAYPQSNYFIQVSAASEIPFNVQAWLTEVPVNDMLSNALPLELSDFQAYNYYATTEPGEILPTGSLGGSVWWSYVPSRGGTLTVSTLPPQGGPRRRLQPSNTTGYPLPGNQLAEHANTAVRDMEQQRVYSHHLWLEQQCSVLRVGGATSPASKAAALLRCRLFIIHCQPTTTLLRLLPLPQANAHGAGICGKAAHPGCPPARGL